MYRQHVSPQTQNKRTSSLICGAKRRTGARIATFGLSVLVAGQLMLPGVALAAEMSETVAGQDAAATAVVQDTAETEAAVAPADDSTAALAPKSIATAPALAAAPASRGATNPGGGKVIINTTVVNHF